MVEIRPSVAKIAVLKVKTKQHLRPQKITKSLNISNDWETQATNFLQSEWVESKYRIISDIDRNAKRTE